MASLEVGRRVSVVSGVVKAAFFEPGWGLWGARLGSALPLIEAPVAMA